MQSHKNLLVAGFDALLFSKEKESNEIEGAEDESIYKQWMETERQRIWLVAQAFRDNALQKCNSG